MESACISSRKDVLRFIGDVFHVLECVAEDMFTEATGKYFQWSCVRVLSAYELHLFRMTGPVVEIRPALGTDRFLVSRQDSLIRINRRLEFARQMTDAITASSDEIRLGMAFVPFEDALRQSLDLLGIQRTAKMRFFHRQFPNWTLLSTEHRFAVHDLGRDTAFAPTVNLPACILMPENELRQWKKYLLTRRWSRNEVGKKRWVLEVREVPISHRLLIE